MRRFRVDRDSYILSQIGRGQTVLHIGCTNAPTTVRRWERGTLLHRLLCELAEKQGAQVTGIDIDGESLDYLRELMPEQELLHLSAEQMAEAFGDRKFDLVVAGDVIEHLANPGLFLAECRRVLSPKGQVLITTANSYGVVRYLKSLLNHEAVHAEHTAYYSHKTLARLSDMCGLRLTDRGYYEGHGASESTLNMRASVWLERAVCAFVPQWSEGVVVKVERGGANAR